MVDVTENVDQVIFGAFKDAVDAGKSETDIKLEMIKVGADFKNVTRLYNKFMIDVGLSMSKEEKQERTLSALQGKDLSTEEGFQSGILALQEEFENLTDRGAQAMLRAYAKANSLSVFEKPKAEKTGTARPGFAAAFHQWLITNIDTVSEEQVTQYVNGTDGFAPTSENVKNHLAIYLAHFRLAKGAYNKAKAA